MSTKLVHFLLVYDHRTQQLVRQQPFDDSTAAVAEYFAVEQQFKDESLIEIVLVGSDSIETVMVTHANYFDGTVNKLSEYLVGL